MTTERGDWSDTAEDWYAALVSDGIIYGLARRIHVPGGVDYQVLDPETKTWGPDPEGAGHFTGIGGVTDAEPITPATARAIETRLLAPAL